VSFYFDIQQCGDYPSQWKKFKEGPFASMEEATVAMNEYNKAYSEEIHGVSRIACKPYELLPPIVRTQEELRQFVDKFIY